MKKLLMVLLALALIAAPVAHAAEVDLSDMSLAELVALRERVQIAMWETAEWQEVQVPIGVYEVGADIPAGHWTITPAAGSWCTVALGSTLSDSGASTSADLAFSVIVSPTFDGYDSNTDAATTDYTVSDGQYLQVMMGSAVFTPYVGKPALGFN